MPGRTTGSAIYDAACGIHEKKDKGMEKIFLTEGKSEGDMNSG